MKAAKKILIAGGGIGGLSSGIAFRKNGFDAEIVEINNEFNVYGVGIIQQANALRALNALGVADEAMKRGSPYGKVKLCTAQGHQFGEAGTPPIGRFPSHNGISRRILHDILYEACVAHGVEFRMGLTVSKITNAEDKVETEFTDGTSGTYDVLIGADGINSKVRHLIFGDYKPVYNGSSVWRYPFKRPAELETGYMFFGKKTKVGLIPMTAETMYMFVVSSESEYNPWISEEEFVPRLKAHLKEYSAKLVRDVVEEITNPKEVNYRPLETLKLPPPWYKGRVLMIGDAAHATIPQLGSGAALAIEDAVVIAELLHDEDDISVALEKFMSRRYERCKMVVEASETLAEWERMEWKGIPLPEGANAGALMGKTLMELTKPI